MALSQLLNFQITEPLGLFVMDMSNYSKSNGDCFFNFGFCLGRLCRFYGKMWNYLCPKKSNIHVMLMAKATHFLVPSFNETNNYQDRLDSDIFIPRVTRQPGRIFVL